MTETSSKVVSEEEEQTLFEGRPALVQDVFELILSVVTLGIWLLPLWWRSRGVHYRITTKRIVVETGVLSQKLEQTDLYRVSDYTVLRPFSQKLLGTGNIVLRTLEKTSTEISLNGLKTDVVDLYEKVRAATEADRLKRGVRVLDTE